MPDAEVMNELVDADADPTRRGVPSGLDVFAAMNAGIAEQVLTGELRVQGDACLTTYPCGRR